MRDDDFIANATIKNNRDHKLTARGAVGAHR
jgi:hypothetical protein